MELDLFVVPLTLTVLFPTDCVAPVKNPVPAAITTEPLNPPGKIACTAEEELTCVPCAGAA